MQIKEECDKFGASSDIKNTVVYGGVPKFKQVSALKSGVEIVIGTPGRLIDHVRYANSSLAVALSDTFANSVFLSEHCSWNKAILT